MIDLALTLVKTLKLGYLKEVKLLASDVEVIFKELVDEFKTNVFSIGALKTIILKDIFNIKGSSSIIENLVARIEAIFNNSYTKMTAAFDKRLSVIKLDQSTYNKLLNSSAFNVINNFTAKMVMNLTPLWDQIKPKMEGIKLFENTLTNSIMEIVSNLSKIIKTTIEAKG